jgi:hypothetical protein
MNDNLESRVLDLEIRVKALEQDALKPGPHVSPVISRKKQSPREFLFAHSPETIVQKTLALGYYFESVDSKGAFNTDDLAAMFRLAKEKSPANINDMINKNIKKGYLMEDAQKAEKKSWVLTSSGEEFVTNNFKE